MSPQRPGRVCPEIGCENTTPCPAHKQDRDRYRGSRQARGYGRAHEGWAKRVLQLDPVCRYCGREPSQAADHITPWRDGGAKYDLDNGAGACIPCHNRKSAIEKAGGTPPVPLPRRQLA